LEELLESLGQNTRETWMSIGKHDGSVQHLDFLDDHQKNVFKTFQEISPAEILIQASQRQQFIDQGQSTNLMINQEVGYKQMNELLFMASDLGIKTLYYQHGTNAAQQLKKNITECESCAG
jgi:ribonucleoside-diphosphate reductase alpha chain